jgi:hypothetical protein
MSIDEILSSLFQAFTDPSLLIKNKLFSFSIIYLLDLAAKTLQDDNIYSDFNHQ